VAKSRQEADPVHPAVIQAPRQVVPRNLRQKRNPAERCRNVRQTQRNSRQAGRTQRQAGMVAGRQPSGRQAGRWQDPAHPGR